MFRYVVICYVTLVAISSSYSAVWPLFFAQEDYTLQLKAWYPYDVRNDLNYWCSFIHQALGTFTGAAWNVTNDTIITGFMMQACAQLDLMSFRLQMLPENTKMAVIREDSKSKIRIIEEKVIKKSVRHHLQIFQ